MSRDEPPSNARVVARAVIVVVLVSFVALGYTMGRPVYWRMYATVLKPFRDDGTLDGARPSLVATTPAAISTAPRNLDHAALHPPHSHWGSGIVARTAWFRPSARICCLEETAEALSSTTHTCSRSQLATPRGHCGPLSPHVLVLNAHRTKGGLYMPSASCVGSCTGSCTCSHAHTCLVTVPTTSTPDPGGN
jgi:hypothetical protein